MNINAATPKSTAGIVWPALPEPRAAALLALQYQLEQTEWWSAEALREAQMNQLGALLHHAYETIPFYRKRLSAAGYQPNKPLTAEIFARIPLLRRSEIQAQGKALLSQQVHPAHGRVTTGVTSGSMGRPITYFGTELAQYFWQAFTLREHVWHGRDIMGRMAAIRSELDDAVAPTWGPPTSMVFPTVSCATLGVRTDVSAQLDWLLKHEVEYLLSYPTNVRALAEASLARKVQLNRLLEVRTLGEMVDPDLRALCRQAWGVGLVDIYSAREVGYLALQCPDHEHYHVQSENVLVEVLDDHDNPCAVGEIGRVVVSTLNNFAMPLIRYEILDHAEVGASCPCGRGLPVLKRILGRQRNMVTFPNGHRHWPSTGYKEWSTRLPILQAQIVQRSLTIVEAKLVPTRPLTPADETEFAAILHRSLGYPFEIVFSYHQKIPRSAGGKFEDFLSEVG
ncbi:MAG: phenylacetate--CoA ligase family protein [Gammaproteobacteria bacterium]|nr:phenylacetate--CoA ligase family protein [Rhodocyclaceae bacterium]MBU3908127.1 phenylacetate--CoA ligase family protein [Gammaproteobacteria bacterium]MBU3990571.1 phenylacetate--CoA ligase family protein [Gammaproteobacteria bacterium]MBU4005768.1 phenylacetate--CoA ligase family protein [Gammaproteobacteria bacterium]MBU4021484.1 phenylacetate--CoA ligase family protein [Gammaproteobacteria bacterium]